MAAALAPAILFAGSQNPEADYGANLVADDGDMLPFCRGVVRFSSRLTMLLIEADTTPWQLLSMESSKL